MEPGGSAGLGLIVGDALVKLASGSESGPPGRAGATGEPPADAAQALTGESSGSAKSAPGAASKAGNKGGSVGEEEDDDSDESDDSDVDDDEIEKRRADFVHKRKPSWLSESHPTFVWGNEGVRKQFREEFQRATEILKADGGLEDDATANSGSDGDDDDDVDDDDMKYGLDPGFQDLDEELRVVEDMISEHTSIKEIEVPDEASADGLDPVESAIRQLQIHGAKRALKHKEFKEKERGKGRDHTETTTSKRVPNYADVSVGSPSGSAPADAARSKRDAAGEASAPRDDQDRESVLQETVALERGAGLHVEAAPRMNAGVALESGQVAPTHDDALAPAPPVAQPTRIRLVELPDYLAMVAREHKRLLLEKQRRDLQIAAEAANAREASSAASHGPRSESRIRRGYFDRLGIAGDSAPVSPTSAVNAAQGIDMGINARRAAIASARTRRKPPSMRVALRESVKPSKNKSFFKKIAQWMASDGSGNLGNKLEGEVEGEADEGPHGSASKPGTQKRHIVFKPLADVYYIPARTDYPAKVRHAIWHSRAEFVDMVMTNMDQVELEMQQEAEAHRRMQDLKNNPPPSRRKK